MPISRKEFESGEVDATPVVEEFLQRNSDNAYTLDELIVELASMRVPLTRDEMRNILGLLEKGVGLNQKKGMVWYTIYVANRPSASSHLRGFICQSQESNLRGG